ncbi:MAG TPA: ATP-dependent 6-phosphofructokinase [Burkholderiales bacterium]|nr:ATP-dependent 6-phosphofructokinase [Burkholderiales bacterium]
MHIAILTSGGDAPGMNAAIRAVTRAASDKGWKVHGVHNGYAGLIADDMTPLLARDVGGIIQRGGTVLGSARSAEFMTPAGRKQGLANLLRRGVDALVVIGGNGSQTGSSAIAATGFPVVGVGSTIDNDLAGTDVTIGVDTAVNITLEAIDRLRTTASSHKRAFLVETMGRNCGYIALMAGIAGGAEVIAIPECEVEPHEVAESLRAAYARGKTHALVVVAEGARHGARAIMQHFTEHRDTIGFGLRVTTLGHVVRGGAPTAADRVLATRLGAAAVDQLFKGRHGVLVGLQGGDIATTPLADIAGKTKPANKDLLNLARILAQ